MSHWLLRRLYHQQQPHSRPCLQVLPFMTVGCVSAEQLCCAACPVCCRRCYDEDPDSIQGSSDVLLQLSQRVFRVYWRM